MEALEIRCFNRSNYKKEVGEVDNFFEGTKTVTIRESGHVEWDTFKHPIEMPEIGKKVDHFKCPVCSRNLKVIMQSTELLLNKKEKLR